MGKQFKIQAPLRVGNMILEKGDVIEILPQEKGKSRRPLTRERRGLYRVNEDLQIQDRKLFRGDKIRITETEQEQLDRMLSKLRFKRGQYR